jgi:cyclophilin family peptidyl-prolyl cis-trans isomerase
MVKIEDRAGNIYNINVDEVSYVVLNKGDDFETVHFRTTPIVIHFSPGAMNAALAALKAEFSTSARHERGTLSMARSNTPDSAGSQFFICHAEAAQLNGSYTIFGYAVTGHDVVDKIVTGEKNPSAGRDYPAIPVHITKITVFEGIGDLTNEEKTAWDALPAGKKIVQ